MALFIIITVTVVRTSLLAQADIFYMYNLFITTM